MLEHFIISDTFFSSSHKKHKIASLSLFEKLFIISAILSALCIKSFIIYCIIIL